MKTGLEIFRTIQKNYAIHYHADDWTVVEYMPDLEIAISIFEWLQENKICYIILTHKTDRAAGFAFWFEEDAVAFKLKWI